MKRFWSKVAKGEPGGCWEWSAYRNAGGYGVVRVAGKNQLAHRVSWGLAEGKIPAGLCVLHRCDNPPCVNPGHLFLGTQLENIADRVSKGRSGGGALSGDDHPGSKLTLEEVEEIRSRYVPREVTQADLAEEFGVSRSAIGLITSRKRR